MADLIKCPHCGNDIEVTSLLTKKIEEELLVKNQKELELIKIDLENKIKKELESKSEIETKELKSILEEKEKKINEFRDQELKLREEKRRLEEKEKEMEISLQRKIDEEKKKIEEVVAKQLIEEHRLKDMEKEKVISDLKRSLEDAQRKASQGSQQTQGEVLELDIENTLKINFPQDLIEPVGKGIRGADIKQTVRSSRGTVCGTILWESKRTKAWTDEWTMKLKDDLRVEKADIPIIISSALPKEAENGFGLKEGVWVANYNLYIPLAIILRKNLLDVGYQKALSSNQGRKADLLYDFVTGNEFRQQVESLVEVYSEMREQLDKEKVVFEKLWKTREGEIKRLLSSTINIYGGVQGLVGSSLPQIKGLEIQQLISD